MGTNFNRVAFFPFSGCRSAYPVFLKKCPFGKTGLLDFLSDSRSNTSIFMQFGFKKIKQEIGNSKSQAKNADAVLNHLNFCMMSTTLTWIYADRLQTSPDRKYKIRGRSEFAFLDVRKSIAEAALDQDFQSICLCQVSPSAN